VEALAKVLEILEDELAEDSIKQNLEIHILILHKGVDLVAIHTDENNFRAYHNKVINQADFIQNLKIDFDLKSVREKLEFKKRKNSSFLKTDIVTGLTVDYIIGNFDNPIRTKFNLQPEVSTVLAKGLTFSTMFNVPLFKNDYDFNSQSNIILSRLSQDYKIIDGLYANTSVGFFTYNRFGISNQIYYHPFKNDIIRLSAGHTITETGYWGTNYKPYFLNVDRYSTYFGGVQYRWRKANMDLDLRYGKYFFFDNSLNVKVIRQYDEKFISFFLNHSINGTLLGFDLQVPIGFRKHLKPTVVRPRFREFFYIPYYYLPKAAGISFYSGENLLLNMKEFYPSNLKMELERYMKVKN
jgi:hypothetical protein